MNKIVRFASVLAVLMVIPTLLHPQKQSKTPERIRITGYNILVQEFEKPLVRLDEKGVKREYSKAYVVQLKGEFGEPRAIPVDIYIGNYKVPEYGGMKGGIYFRIYEERLLEELEGKQFGYGYENQKVGTFDLRFTPKKLKPFKKFSGHK